MSPRFRLVAFVVLGLFLGVFIGVGISNEDYGWATVTALACCWLLIEKTSDALPDAWLLAVVLVGYVVGNRGFAQLHPSARLPLLPAEAVLLVAVPSLAFRMAMKRVPGVRRDALNYLLVLWIVVGAARLPLDLREYGVMALRDFAMVYYAAFFFIAQAYGSHAPSDRILKGALTAAFLLLPPVVVSIQLAPDFLLEHFTVQGVPVIYQKSDLIATSLAGGFFWLWTRAEKSGRRAWVLPAALSLLLIGVVPSPRAAMAAVLCTNALWLAVRRWRIVAAQAAWVAAGSVVALCIALALGSDLKTTAPYSAYEHAVSVFDPGGTRTYINTESGDLGGNNQFRLIWWRDVISETLSVNPVLGLGFGADLASRFLSEYEPLADETFAARSPHSMAVSVFGRQGIVGIVLWAAVSAYLGRMVWRLFRRGEPDGVGLASIVCATWVSACFGVVLEGPMGAVVFWTVAGLANAAALRAPVAGTQGGETPVAKAGALDTQSATR